MSGNNPEDSVGIEMEEKDDPSDSDYRLTEEKEAEGPSYKETFRDILTDHYDDEKTWWGAVKDLIKGKGDFAEKVAAKSHAEGEKQREDAIVEVMVDLLLDMEGITVHKGLVYVLDEGLESYPLELMAVELLKRGADPNKEKGYSGSTPLHLAITEKKLDLVKTLLENGADLEAKDDDGSTPFYTAVRDGAPEDIIDLLLKNNADVYALGEDRKTALHFAAQRDEENMVQQMIKKGLSVDAEDKVGWRPLHEAAHYGSKVAAAVLVKKGALLNARDHRKRTPLHVAAEEGEKEFIALLLKKKADANVTDLDGNTPLDLAAKKQHRDAVQLLQKYSSSSKKDNAVKKTLAKAVNPDSESIIRDTFVKGKIGELSPFSVVSMLKPKKCGGEGKFHFLEHFAKKPELKKTTRAIMDQFVLGKRRGQVNCEIIDADMKGIPPGGEGFDETSPSLVDVIVEQNDKELAQHPSIKAILDHKWKTFGRWLFMMSFVLYAVRMLFFGLALLIAARPDIDNPGCYKDEWDYFRGVCEGISIIFFLFKLGDEIQEMFTFPRAYIKDYYNYQQLLAVILPLLIIPFRAATTWCASTGDGYCADPTILPNATNLTIDINMACITASHVQWIIASLAYMANAILILEFLALSKTLGVYVKVILGIVVKDLLKFSVIFFVALYIFVGSFYLALRSGMTVDMATGDIKSDLEVFGEQTLYPWHVVYTGFRILIESGNIFEENYLSYQWFAIVMYLAFLFGVVVVLLNLLIAQMSDTYEKIQSDADGTFAIARARIIARLQKGKGMFCKGKTYRERYFQKEVWTELTPEELKQDEQEEDVEGKAALMDQKTDWLKETAAELTRKLQKREDSAQEIKRLLEEKVDYLTEVTNEGLLHREGSAQQIKSGLLQKVDNLTIMTAEGQQNREDSAQQIKSSMEQRLDQLNEVTTQGLQNREDSAQEVKRVIEEKVDRLSEMTAEGMQKREDSAQRINSSMEQRVDHLTGMTAEVKTGLMNREDSAQQIKRVIEEKVDHLSEKTAQELQNREDSAQQIKRLLELKVDRLAEMMTELMRRLPKAGEEGWPAPEMRRSRPQ